MIIRLSLIAISSHKLGIVQLILLSSYNVVCIINHRYTLEESKKKVTKKKCLVEITKFFDSMELKKFQGIKLKAKAVNGDASVSAGPQSSSLNSLFKGECKHLSTSMVVSMARFSGKLQVPEEENEAKDA